MNVAFIVTLNLDDLSDLPGVAEEITGDLTENGFTVVSAQPWARPTLSQGTPAINVPTITQQPNQTQL